MQATGTITTRDAVKSALNEFASRGIIGFTDKAGRHWNMDSYAEMAVRTDMMRAMREGYRQDALEHGEELVIISEHEDTCPMCVDWERAVLALTDAAAQHPEAEGTLAEAEAAGLFHPNCGHSMTVYVPGLTDKTSRKRETLGYTREQDLEGYANRQQQRYMERQVRAWKRRQAVATTPEDERYAKAYVDKWQRQLRAYTGETKLPRKYSREGGRVTLSDAARRWKSFDKKALLQNGGKIKMGDGSEKQEKIAKRIYNEIRSREPFADAKTIAQHVTGFSVEDIEEIRQHIFLREHELDGGWHRFDEDYEQARLWERLIAGTDLLKSDTTFLHHEFEELTIMRELGYNYPRAHDLADQKYPWWKEYCKEVE